MASELDQANTDHVATTRITVQQWDCNCLSPTNHINNNHNNNCSSSSSNHIHQHHGPQKPGPAPLTASTLCGAAMGAQLPSKSSTDRASGQCSTLAPSSQVHLSAFKSAAQQAFWMVLFMSIQLCSSCCQRRCS